MLIQYIYGCVSSEKAAPSIKTVTVSVTSGGANSESLAQQKALAVAKDNSLGDPHLMAIIGVPDIRIVVEGGEVVAVYYRNSGTPPTFTVSDLDTSERPKDAGDALLHEMERDAYSHAPFLVAPVKP